MRLPLFTYGTESRRPRSPSIAGGIDSRDSICGGAIASTFSRSSKIGVSSLTLARPFLPSPLPASISSMTTSAEAASPISSSQSLAMRARSCCASFGDCEASCEEGGDELAVRPLPLVEAFERGRQAPVVRLQREELLR